MEFNSIYFEVWLIYNYIIFLKNFDLCIHYYITSHILYKLINYL